MTIEERKKFTEVYNAPDPIGEMILINGVRYIKEDAVNDRIERLEKVRSVAVEAFEAILKKKPHDVNQNEAADMAIEFQLVSSKALTKINEILE